MGATSPALPVVALGTKQITALLAVPVLVRTEHFMLHAPATPPHTLQLPTEFAPVRSDSVDNIVGKRTLGIALVVPKRHAKRAVMRNLIKRQMRDAVQRHVHVWPPGALLIRLRRPFSTLQYPSAASAALRSAARSELEQLLVQAVATL